MPTLDYADQTLLHPLGLVAIILLSLWHFLAPRRQALLPLLILTLFISGAQRIAIFTLDFSFVRIIALVGVARILLRRELRGLRWSKMDKAFLLWTVSGVIIYTLRRASSAALVFKLGQVVEFGGIYFVGRALLRDWRDLINMGRYLAFLSIPVALAFIREKATARNVFAFFGGVNEITMLREDKLRAQGAFAHPIIAGCFWATTLPTIVAGWWYNSRGTAVIGSIGGMIVIFACASSTPIMCVLIGIGAACLFPWRSQMALFRTTLVVTLVGLHFVMQGPVWSLIARIDIVGGSTGYHRYKLIDAAIFRFREWALLGTNSTTHWGWGLFDLTCQYVSEGVKGGALTLAFFILCIVRAYQCVGQTLRLAGRVRRHQILAWSLGVVMFVHTICFLVLGYFGQMDTLLCLQFGMFASLAQQPASVIRRPQPRADAVGAPAAESGREPSLAPVT